MILIKTKPAKERRKADFAIFVDSPVDWELDYFAQKRGFRGRRGQTLDALRYGQWVVFGTSSDYDFEVIKNEADLVGISIKEYTLTSDYNRTINLLNKYDEKRNPDVEITVTLVKEEVVTCPCGRVSIEPVTVHENFVKVGYDLFKIKTDKTTGKRYVKIDGKIYLVKRDFCGNLFLA